MEGRSEGLKVDPMEGHWEGLKVDLTEDRRVDLTEDRKVDPMEGRWVDLMGGHLEDRKGDLKADPRVEWAAGLGLLLVALVEARRMGVPGSLLVLPPPVSTARGGGQLSPRVLLVLGLPEASVA